MESPLRNRLLSILLCFFLSGAAGLIYQVAWSKALGLIFGHTVYAVAVVLAVFMAGLAAGSAYFGARAEASAEPLVLYARLEFLVGAGGVLSLLGLAGVRSFYAAVYSHFGSWQPLLLLLRLLGTALVLFVPTFLMGGTLPVLVRSVTRHSRELGVRFSQLYWVNTLGAVIGTLLSGFVFLPAFGLRITTACAVVLNLLAGLIARWIAKERIAKERIAKERDSREPAKGVPAKGAPVKGVPVKIAALKPSPQQTGTRALLLVFALIGCTAFAYEIAWTRLLAVTVGSSTYAFTLMLATFLSGIVIGSALFQRFRAGSSRVSMVTLARSQIGIGVAALASLIIFPRISTLIPYLLRSTHETFSGLVLTQFLTSALAVLPVAILFGFNFPLVVLLIDGGMGQNKNTGSSETVGKAYAANTMGAIFGSVITGFWLVPWLGTFRVIVAAAVVNLLLSFVLNWRAQQRRILPLLLDLACVAAALVIGFSSFFYNQSLLSLSAVLYGNSHQGRLSFAEIAATYDLVFAADGVNDSIAVLRTDNTVVLRVNGKVDASTGDAPTQLLVGHLGGIFQPAPKRVLIIGFGSGMTVSAISHYPDVEKIDCIEIEPAVIRAAPYLESLNHNVLQDPRVHIIFDDARNFLLTTHEQYDLIISEPSNPWIAGIATLFTEEYYVAARRRLAPGGIFVQWVQAYFLEPSDLRMILATFAPHFPEVTLWRGENPDLLLLGRTAPKPFQFDRLRALWKNQALQKDFSALSIHQPEGLFAYYLLDDPAIRKLAAGSPVNTDDRTLLEYDAPRALLKRDLSDMNQELLRQFRAGPLPQNFLASEIRPALEASLATALDLNDTGNAQIFLSALQSGPASAAGYIGQGRLALAQGALPDAQTSLEAALKLDPGSSEAMHWLAVAEHRSGENALADAQVEQILKLHPDFLPALEDRMLFAVDRSDFRNAVTAQLDRMALMPDVPAAEYCRLGAMWMKVPNLTVAEPVLLKGLLKDPYSYSCHLELGELYRQTNRLALARQHFEWVVRFFPDAYSTVFRSLAGVYIALGDTHSALSILNKGRRLFPDDEQLQKAKELVEAGQQGG